jgi:hypothetical protein
VESQKKNTILKIILDYKNCNKKNGDQTWQSKKLNEDKIEIKIQFHKLF